MSLAEIELGCLCYAIIYKWFNLCAGLAFPVAMDNSSLGPESQSSRQVQGTPGWESSWSKRARTNGSESTYSDRKK